MDRERIFIKRGVEIPQEELTFTASRSSGPGGQKVNKTSSRVTLWFDLAGSPSLREEVKGVLLLKLATRINREGKLFLVARESRSQAHNRERALERFVRLLGEALERPRPRIKTGIPAAAKERRLAAKKRRAGLKRSRASEPSRDSA